MIKLTDAQSILLMDFVKEEINKLIHGERLPMEHAASGEQCGNPNNTFTPVEILEPALQHLAGTGDTIFTINVTGCLSQSPTPCVNDQGYQFSLGVEVRKPDVMGMGELTLEDFEPKNASYFLPACVQARLVSEAIAAANSTAPVTCEEQEIFESEANKTDIGHTLTKEKAALRKQRAEEASRRRRPPAGMRIRAKLAEHARRMAAGDSAHGPAGHVPDDVPSSHLVADKDEDMASDALPSSYNPFYGTDCLSQLHSRRQVCSESTTFAATTALSLNFCLLRARKGANTSGTPFFSAQDVISCGSTQINPRNGAPYTCSPGECDEDGPVPSSVLTKGAYTYNVYAFLIDHGVSTSGCVPYRQSRLTCDDPPPECPTECVPEYSSHLMTKVQAVGVDLGQTSMDESLNHSPRVECEEELKGTDYSFCAETGVHYCCGVCSSTEACPDSSKGTAHCACDKPLGRQLFETMGGTDASIAGGETKDGNALKSKKPTEQGKRHLSKDVVDKSEELDSSHSDPLPSHFGPGHAGGASNPIVFRSEANVAAAMKRYGTLTCSFETFQSFADYRSGGVNSLAAKGHVYMGKAGPDDEFHGTGHVVACYGFGVLSDGTKYWQCINSWGDAGTSGMMGHRGEFRMLRAPGDMIQNEKGLLGACIAAGTAVEDAFPETNVTQGESVCGDWNKGVQRWWAGSAGAGNGCGMAGQENCTCGTLAELGVCSAGWAQPVIKTYCPASCGCLDAQDVLPTHDDATEQPPGPDPTLPVCENYEAHDLADTVWVGPNGAICGPVNGQSDYQVGGSSSERICTCDLLANWGVCLDAEYGDTLRELCPVSCKVCSTKSKPTTHCSGLDKDSKVQGFVWSAFGMECGTDGTLDTCTCANLALMGVCESDSVHGATVKDACPGACGMCIPIEPSQACKDEAHHSAFIGQWYVNDGVGGLCSPDGSHGPRCTCKMLAEFGACSVGWTNEEVPMNGDHNYMREHCPESCSPYGDCWAEKYPLDLDQCINAGGDGYEYCPDTGVNYCCTVCNKTAACPSNSGLNNCACDEVSSEGLVEISRANKNATNQRQAPRNPRAMKGAKGGVTIGHGKIGRRVQFGKKARRSALA